MGRPCAAKFDCSTASVDTGMPSSTQIAEFYASLSPKDKLIHDLAAKMLKTRYDPVRSNAYIAFASKTSPPSST
jgi:hypothetical protein